MESATKPRPLGGTAAPRDEARRSASPCRRRRRDSLAIVRDYLALTKPRIISLLLLTTVATMIVAKPRGPGALDGALDDARRLPRRRRRRGDQPLHRPRARRPHGPHARAPARRRAGSSRCTASWFGIALGIARRRSSWRSPSTSSRPRSRWPGCSATSSSTRIWLKPLTPQNIVIGGAAGAVPPLVGWAAATGGLTLEALYPFGIVFLWTPPHFWALSLLIKDDYARTGVPMLPVVRGEAFTRRQIVVYTLVLVAFTLAPVVTGLFGGALPASARCSSGRNLPRPGGPPPARPLASRRRCACTSLRSPIWPCCSCAMALDRALGV